jgi:5-methylcytosine-specific restriction endonuclease McrA
MKFELLIFGVTAFFIANTYYDNKYIDMMKTWKKYYQMIGIGFVGISAYVFLKKYPDQSRTLFTHANSVVKYLPIDRNTTHFFSPILDLARFGAGAEVGNSSPQERRMMNSGQNGGVGKTTKRSVSETKKKYVAAQQGWKCGDCKEQLPAWFEVDHIVRLDSGGSNHIDNLVAYCRNCHGKKTALENL